MSLMEHIFGSKCNTHQQRKTWDNQHMKEHVCRDMHSKRKCMKIPSDVEHLTGLKNYIILPLTALGI